MSLPAVRVRTFYPADPLGVVPGGVDTFLRGLIKWAPDDLAFSLVGMSTDPAQRPLARWQRCRIGAREFDFFPAVAQRDAGGRSRVPLSLRFSIAVWQQMARLHGGFDVFDFHRLAPSMLFGADLRPKNVYFHNDPQTLRLQASDNLWRHAPGTYEWLERRAMAAFSRVWCVRETGVQVLRQRHPALAGRIGFVPTWADEDTFHPVDPARRHALRHAKAQTHGLDTGVPWLISVGRLDTQKDPALTLRALARLHAAARPAHWIVVGAGVLQPALEREAAQLGLGRHVHFVGLLPPAAIADWLRACDVFVLSSAYEGMPMALLEALGCGLPAAVTDVGEVRRVVTPGINGAIADGRDVDAFAQTLAQVIEGAALMRDEAAVAAVEEFRPAQVLAPVYDGYRRLGDVPRRLHAAAAARAATVRALPHVAGVPVHALDRDAVLARVLGWAHQHQSRYVCFVNVHSAVQASRDERHRLVLAGADLNAPDGTPVAWTLGVKTGAPQQRVDGPGTMLLLCGKAAALGIKVGLYGSTPATLRALANSLRAQFPRIDVAYAHSPPFRDPSAAEDEAVHGAVGAAGVGLLFVGLGCPKQEYWMAAQRGRMPAVMLGVGAAFDFIAGTVTRAPPWMRHAGLEWVHRIGQQPLRLGRRYMVTNSLFLMKTARELQRTFLQRAPAALRPTTPPPELSDFQETIVEPYAPPGHAAPPRFRLDAHTSVDTRPFEQLSARVDSQVPLAGDGRGRLIGFIGSAGGEGTSTTARAYVATGARLSRRVLLMETHSRGTGLLHALSASLPLDLLMRPLPGGGVVASLGDTDASQSSAEAPLSRIALWDELRRHFDEIVLDLPAHRSSAAGLGLARHCDGVVVVLEGGKTRATVARALVDDLRSVRANVLGSVLNKRRFYVPQRIYGWL